MYDGSIKMVQDIADGEFVMGDDSNPRPVYGSTSGSERMYKIIPRKGDPFSCNESHILTLIWNGAAKHSIYGWEKDSTVNISVKDYLLLKQWEKDHLVMYRTGWGKNFEEVSHSIPPYIMGVYLGDGCKTFGNITGVDPEVRDEIERYAESINYSVVDRDEVTYAIVKKKQKGVNIVGVAKNRGDSKSDTFVKWSIGLVQNQRISVTKRSLNIIREYRNYLWSVDKDGKILNEPEHEFSHSMDAIRYKFVQLIGKPVVKNVIASSPVLPYYADRDIPF
jgi:hypothetical protein